ncbi:MAG: Nif3-like dinuclear metal center hexameric protein [Bacteroidales bacterium]|nr:Nif3-like dinuclear metal center hexameric protein [Bacteroidales bacterium]
MLIKEVIAYMEELAPLPLQESYDNAGLQIGDALQTFSGGLVCLDVSMEVLQEAVASGANLVISHHPVLFHPLRQVSTETLAGEVVMYAVRHNLVVYSAHTNLDNARDGMNACLGRLLHLENLRVLLPNPRWEHAGSGAIGELPDPMTEGEFLAMVKRELGAESLRHSRLDGRSVRRVALCGGAGAFLLPEALRQEADAFVVGEVHYHDFVDFQGRVLMVETGHYESECVIKSDLVAKLNRKFSNFAASKKEKTPYQHL